ncbi:MAG: hypothetical protein IJ489_11565 [Clostridia bacterium]|nr:hypothetical protein [Clostridia bacterium]
MMINPSIEQLTQGKFNRYALVIATAKCARIVTDEYVKQREAAEKILEDKDKKSDKTLASMIDKDIRDNKAVENAVQRLYRGEFSVIIPEDTGEEHLK